MRVALYARYSSDQQNARSAEDQLQALRLLVQARGWSVAEEFADLGISGATLSNRHGVQQLLRAAERGAFDVCSLKRWTGYRATRRGRRTSTSA